MAEFPSPKSSTAPKLPVAEWLWSAGAAELLPSFVCQMAFLHACVFCKLRSVLRFSRPSGGGILPGTCLLGQQLSAVVFCHLFSALEMAEMCGCISSIHNDT